MEDLEYDYMNDEDIMEIDDGFCPHAYEYPETGDYSESVDPTYND